MDQQQHNHGSRKDISKTEGNATITYQRPTYGIQRSKLPNSGAPRGHLSLREGWTLGELPNSGAPSGHPFLREEWTLGKLPNSGAPSGHPFLREEWTLGKLPEFAKGGDTEALTATRQRENSSSKTTRFLILNKMKAKQKLEQQQIINQHQQ